MSIFTEGDKRPSVRGWAPGPYINLCSRCEEVFIGDKRATECADCAYSAYDTLLRDLFKSTRPPNPPFLDPEKFGRPMA